MSAQTWQNRSGSSRRWGSSMQLNALCCPFSPGFSHNSTYNQFILLWLSPGSPTQRTQVSSTLPSDPRKPKQTSIAIPLVAVKCLRSGKYPSSTAGRRGESRSLPARLPFEFPSPLAPIIASQLQPKFDTATANALICKCRILLFPPKTQTQPPPFGRTLSQQCL